MMSLEGKGKKGMSAREIKTSREKIKISMLPPRNLLRDDVLFTKEFKEGIDVGKSADSSYSASVLRWEKAVNNWLLFPPKYLNSDGMKSGQMLLDNLQKLSDTDITSTDKVKIRELLIKVRQELSKTRPTSKKAAEESLKREKSEKVERMIDELAADELKDLER